MDLKEIQETPIWGLYEKGRNYQYMANVITDTDKNYRFYNGDQWEGVKLDGVEPVQKNFIKPIVKYKLAVIHDNLYAIHYSSQNYDREFRPQSERYCEMLNRYASNVWEQEKMDFKGRRVTKDAAINDEGIFYVDFDREAMKPKNEIIKKNDIFYGNENDDDIQSQPYILIRKRMPEVTAKEFAEAEGVSAEQIEYIIPDNLTQDESGEAAKLEVDDMVTVIYKFYKQKGTVHFSVATRLVEIIKDADMGIKLYPIAHFVWEEKEGSARGEGEVRYLIPNQIEVNKTEMRRVLAVKLQAYPTKVVDISKVSNPSDLDVVGAVIETNGTPVDDVNKIVGVIPPAQMSRDVVDLQNDLINVTRDLAGAGDTATGQVNPESASGRAILAVQQASQAPMTEQKGSYKNLIEDVALIWMEYITAYSKDGIDMEEEVTDANGEKFVQMVRVPQKILEQLKATVKIDVTPKSVYDRFAQEQTLENFLMNGLFNPQRLGELETYVESLDDDAVAPKRKLQAIVKRMKEDQLKIARMEAEAQMMQQRAQQFLMGGPEEQGQQIADARMQLMAEQEAGLDEKIAQAEEEIDNQQP
jgi:hypothetical protein